MKSKLTLLAISLFALTVVLFTSQNASAIGSANANLPVSSVVSANCFVTTSPIIFSYMSGQLTSSTASGSVLVECNSGTNFTVDLDAGLMPDGILSLRNMVFSGNLLPYYLTWNANSAYAGSTMGGIGGVSIADIGLGFGSPVTIAIDGAIPALQNVPPGTYNDTVVATVSW